MKIGIYCRVSGDNQKDNTSLQNQREKGIGFCKRNGYEYEVFSEVISGKIIKRDELIKLEYKIQNKLLNGIWLYDWDRMIRDIDVMVYFRNLVRDTNCKVYVDNEEKNIFEDSGSLEFGIRSLLSDYERRKIKSRMDFGKRSRLSEGKIILGVIGIGYRKENDRVIIDESQKSIIQDCFKLYLDKRVKSWRDLVRKLTTKYGEKLDKRINERSLFRILQDEKYKGIQKINWNGEDYEINIGRIIDDELFDLVNEKIKKIKTLRRGNQIDNYLLKGKVRCCNCNQIMWVRKGGNYENHQIYSYYNCQTNKKINKKIWDDRFQKDDLIKCKSKSQNLISIQKLEKLVWDVIYYVRSNSDNIKNEYLKKIEKSDISKNKMKGKLLYYEREIEKTNSKKERVLETFINGEIDKEEKEILIKKVNLDLNKVKNKRDEVKIEFMKYENKYHTLTYLDLMKQDLDNDYRLERFEDRKRIIDKYVDEIKVELIQLGEKNQKTYNIQIKFNINDDNFNDLKSINNHQKNDNKNKYNLYILNSKNMELDDLIYNKFIQIHLSFVINIFNTKYTIINPENSIIEFI